MVSTIEKVLTFGEPTTSDERDNGMSRGGGGGGKRSPINIFPEPHEVYNIRTISPRVTYSIMFIAAYH